MTDDPAMSHLIPGAQLGPYTLLAVFSAVLLLAGVAGAQITVVDDFETYADTTALQMAWVASAPLSSPDVTLDTAGIDGKSMSIAYDVSGGANAVEFTFDADQNYTLRITVRILYKVTSGSNNEDIVFELCDSTGAVLGSAVAPDGTSVGSAVWEVDLVHGFSNRAPSV